MCAVGAPGPVAVGDPHVVGGPVVAVGAPAGPAGGLNPAGARVPPVGGRAPGPMTVPGGGNAAAALRMAEVAGHPHINNDNVMANVDAIMAPRQFDKTADAALFKHLQDQGVINKDGKIDFTKLGLSQRQIKRAGLKGQVFIKENGELDFNIKGKCGENAVKALEGFKKAIGGFIEGQPELGKNITLQINPSNVATPSAADLDVLRRGGQIQYRPGDTYTENIDGQDVELQNTVKLTLDPGESGGGDGLTVQVLNATRQEVGSAGPIPLDVVFGGKEHEGHKALKDGQPILPQWRDRKLFEGAQVHVERTGLGAPKSNVNDTNRIQAENNLWSGVMDYLRATSKVTVGAFDVGGGDAAPDVADAGAATGAARIERDAQLNTLYADLNAYLAKPRDVTSDGVKGYADRLQALNPQPGTPERNLLNYLNQLQQAIADPTRGMDVVRGVPPEVNDHLVHLRTGLTELQNAIATGASSEEIYQAIKTANGNAATQIGQHCPAAAVNVALTGLRQEAVNAILGEINGADAATLSNPNRINGFGDRLAQVDLGRDSAESNQVGQALLGKLTADPGGPWRAMATSGDAGRIAELQRQVEAFEHHFPNAVPDDIKNARVAAVAGPTAAELNAFYTDLNNYLRNPRDVTSDGVKGYANRLQALNPQPGTPERNLLNYLNQLQQAIADPTRGMDVVRGVPPEVNDHLVHLRTGLTELQNAIATGASSEEIYQAIKTANGNAATQIGQHCPAAAVNVALTGLRQEAVEAMVGEIHAADAADLAQVDSINGFGGRLAQVDLGRDSAESNQVGQALLGKLTADPGGPWRAMATDPARQDALRQQVAAFEHHFPNVVPDDIKNARAAAAAPVVPPAAPPPPPPGAGDPARGGELAKNNWAQLKAMHLYGAAAVDPIPKATAKVQLEAMLQAYRDICAYANTQRQADAIKQDARNALANNLSKELANIDGLRIVPQITKDITQMQANGLPDVQCEDILQKYINACT